jgi:hypothetical protein
MELDGFEPFVNARPRGLVEGVYPVFEPPFPMAEPTTEPAPPKKGRRRG